MMNLTRTACRPAILLLAACLAIPSAALATFYSETVTAGKPLLYWTFDEAEASAPAAQQVPLAAGNSLVPANGAGARISHAAAGTGLRLGNALDLSEGFFLNREELKMETPALEGAYAVELWFQSQGDNTGTYLLNFGPQTPGGDNAPAVIFRFNEANFLELFAGAGGRTDTGGPEVEDEAWHHLVVLNYGPVGGEEDPDHHRVDFWIDGTHYPNAGTVNRAMDLRAVLVGAALTGGANKFTGSIDEVAVYDLRALPDAASLTERGGTMAARHRTAALAATGPSYRETVLEDAPVVYWTFDEAEGAAADQAAPIPDNSLNELQLSGSATRTPHSELASGLQLGSAADFDGGGSFQILNGLQAGVSRLSGAWGLEMWVQFTADQQQRYLVNLGGGGRNSPAVIYGYFGPRLEVFGNGRSETKGIELNDRAWHHLLVVNYGAPEEESQTNRVDFFIDGEQYENTGNGFNQPVDLTGWLIFGAATDSNEGGMTGRLDELAIYDFSDAGGIPEVEERAKALAAAHLAAAYGLEPGGSVTITQQPAGLSAQLGQTVTFSAAAVTQGTAASLTWQWFRNGAPINGATGASHTTPPLSLYDIGEHSYTVRASAGAAFTVSQAAVLTVAAPPAAPATGYSGQVMRDNPVLYWNFDEFTGDAGQLMPAPNLPVTAENDLVPAMGAGSRISHTTEGTGLRLGNAADLSGGLFRTFGTRTGKTTLTGPYAVEMWFQSQAENPRKYLMNFGPSGGDNSPAFIWNFTENHLEFFGGADGRTGAGGPVLEPDDRAWHHLLVVQYGELPDAEGRVDLWLDGEHTAFAGMVARALDLRGIVAGAALPDGADAFTGRIDELAVYDLSELPDAEAVTARGELMAAARQETARSVTGPEYSAIVLADQPVLYWNFDEEEGSALQKAPVTAAEGDPSSTRLVPFAAGRVQHSVAGSGLLLGNAADFNGSGWYQAANLYTGLAQGPWAVEFWMQVQGENTTNRHDYLLNFGVDDPAFLYDRSGDALEMVRAGSENTGNNPVITDSSWHHVMWVYFGDGVSGEADRAEVWIDGSPAGVTRDSFSGPLNMTRGFIMGARVPGYDTFTGRLDELAIYDLSSLADEAAVTARAQQLIAAHRAAATTPAAAPPPVLNIAASGDTLMLSWQGAVPAGLTLQQSDDLAEWTDVPGPLANPVTLPVPAEGGKMFYRLIQK